MNRREILKLSAMMLGTTMSASLSQAIMAGVKPGTLPNVNLSADQSKNIAMLAEMFIPTTYTPGAIAAGVPEFIETIITEWYRVEERAIFMDGLAALDNAPFFKKLKELVITGYYTSEIGCKE